MRDVQSTLTACEAVLARRGITGHYTLRGRVVTWSRWSSSREETTEALREAEEELLRAGFDAVNMPGAGVVVQRALVQVPDWKDGEAATLNGESSEETEEECAAQAAE